MRKHWLRYVVLLVAAVVLGQGLAWFLNNHDRVEETRRSGYSVAARLNPWLALQLFMEQAGGRAREVTLDSVWQEPPPPGATLISNRLAHVLSETRRRQLLDWVDGGGQLIVVVSDLTPEADAPLRLGGVLEPFAIEYQYHGGYAPDTMSFPLTAGGDDIEVAFQRYAALVPGAAIAPDNALGGEDGGFQVLQYTWGQGRVSVLSDGYFLRNWQIDEYDHAWFFYQLSGAADGREVWFAYTRQASSLWAWLWRHGAWLILTAALLLAVWLWSRNLRAGPLQFPLSTQRRHLGEHLQASAEFLWRHSRDRAFITAARQRALQAWVRRYPALQRKNLSRQVAWVGEHLGFDDQDSALLARAESVDERDLPHLTRLLQAMRYHLPKAPPRHAAGAEPPQHDLKRAKL